MVCTLCIQFGIMKFVHKSKNPEFFCSCVSRITLGADILDRVWKKADELGHILSRLLESVLIHLQNYSSDPTNYTDS